MVLWTASGPYDNQNHPKTPRSTLFVAPMQHVALNTELPVFSYGLQLSCKKAWWLCLNFVIWKNEGTRSKLAPRLTEKAGCFYVDSSWLCAPHPQTALCHYTGAAGPVNIASTAKKSLYHDRGFWN